jgi:hypothetical protein
MRNAAALRENAAAFAVKEGEKQTPQHAANKRWIRAVTPGE